MRASKEARTHRQWRAQVARLIALACWPELSGAPMRECVAGIVDGVLLFDVHAARSYAERLIAEGERLERERLVFMDWTRERGMGPENVNAFATRTGDWRIVVGKSAPGLWTLAGVTSIGKPLCVTYRAKPHDDGCHIASGLAHSWGSHRPSDGGPTFGIFSRGPVQLTAPEGGEITAKEIGHFWLDSGGWPGPLAREWGTVRCEACEGKGLVVLDSFDCDCEDGEIINVFGDKVGCVGCDGDGVIVERERCKPCKGRGYVKRHGREPAAANGGAWMIRAGRRLLDAIDGRCPWAPSAAAQPSECQRCKDAEASKLVSCGVCRGTGHNLSGTLPPVEDSEAAIVSVADAVVHSTQPHHAVAPWQHVVYERNSERVDVLTGDDEDGNPRTRVVPRGQHRDPGFGYDVEPSIVVGHEPEDRPPLDARINGRCWTTAGRPMVGLYEPLAPRWVNGERRHAEQRRERERGIMRQAFETAAANMRDAATFNYAAIAERMARATERG